MRFFSYELGGVVGLAAGQEDGGYRGLLSSQQGFPGTLDEVVRNNSFAAAARALSAGAPVDLDTVTCRPPLSNPGKILCVGLNYADHAAESDMEVPSFPTVFVRFPTSYVAHNAPLVRPNVSDDFDYEAEVVAVIGKAGRGISLDDALDHVCGYSIFNDGSIRDYQLQTSQWTVGKNFDATGGFGPVFVTADELPRGAAGLKIETRLNGKTLQSANTDDLIFNTARLVSLLSTGMTLEAGDLIVTGTPSGVGMARNPPVFMRPGDICEVSVEGIGILRNPVVAQENL